MTNAERAELRFVENLKKSPESLLIEKINGLVSDALTKPIYRDAREAKLREDLRKANARARWEQIKNSAK